jgi:hypothetical protein
MSRFDPAADIYLVYVRGSRGPSPRLIAADRGEAPLIDESIKGRLLSKTKLRIGDRGKSFAELATLYPPPKVPIDA